MPAKPKVDKRAKRRSAQKEKKRLLKVKADEILARNQELVQQVAESQMQARALQPKTKEPAKEEAEVIEYVAAVDLDEDYSGPQLEEFKRVFGRFQLPQEMGIDEEEKAKEMEEAETKEKEGQEESDEDEDAEEEEEEKVMSNKERRERGRLSIAELKQLVSRPEIVDIHDCNSTDPKLLVMLKSYRNTVPVPRHWCDRRKYLQNKRGIEKPPFELPAFIAATGIGEIRGAQQQQAAGQSLKQSQRARMRPKAGKMDIDYHVLHDAFFVNQTKPPMTNHADLYYEGKEYEAKLKNKRPGHLSDELMRALGMTEGHKSPAPWLYNMQRFGPPPSYPNLKLPGVNWPIPEGCRYGTLEGEWGKPPVDEYGRPLYGDVFGTEHKEESSAPLSVELWGVLQEEEQVESEDESEEELENDEDEDMEDEDIDESGLESVQSGVSGLSTPSGLTTPDVVNIRKDGTGSETPTEVRSLYTVIEEKKTSVGGGLFGTDRTYVLPTGNQGIEQKRAAMRGQVNVALNPDELETLDAASLKRKYDQQLKDQSNVAVAERSEVDEVIEEEARKKKRKTGQASTSTKKKYKDFKF